MQMLCSVVHSELDGRVYLNYDVGSLVPYMSGELAGGGHLWVPIYFGLGRRFEGD